MNTKLHKKINSGNYSNLSNLSNFSNLPVNKINSSGIQIAKPKTARKFTVTPDNKTKFNSQGYYKPMMEKGGFTKMVVNPSMNPKNNNLHK